MSNEAERKKQETHIETIGGTTYEVISHYDEQTSFIDLLKWILRRDVERAYS